MVSVGPSAMEIPHEYSPCVPPPQPGAGQLGEEEQSQCWVSDSSPGTEKSQGWAGVQTFVRSGSEEHMAGQGRAVGTCRPAVTSLGQGLMAQGD